jgi:hypothetical protein
MHIVVGMIGYIGGSDMAQPARIGRPPISGEAKRIQFNTRIRGAVRRILEAEAAASGRSLSERIETVLEEHVARADRSPLINLLAALLPTVDPGNHWQEATPAGMAARRAIIRAASRMMERLAHPQDPGLFSLEPGPEGLTDGLLHDAGREVPDPETAQYVWRWAAEIRRHLGALGPLLVAMHQARQGTAWSPAVMHAADNLNLLQAALEQIRALLASTRIEVAAIAGQGGESPASMLARLEQVEAALTQLMLAGGETGSAAEEPSP